MIKLIEEEDEQSTIFSAANIGNCRDLGFGKTYQNIKGKATGILSKMYGNVEVQVHPNGTIKIYENSGTEKKSKKNDSTVESVSTVADLKKLDKWAKEKFSTLDEAYACQAQMMNVRNQLMKKLGDDFTVTGGTTVPKMTVSTYKAPNLAWDITPNGQNVDITPKVDNVPDTLHKKKGIAYMRAGDVLYNFIMDTLKSMKIESKGRGNSMKLTIKEDFNDDQYFVGVFKSEISKQRDDTYDEILTTNSESEAWEFALIWNMRGYFIEFSELDGETTIYQPYELEEQPELTEDFDYEPDQMDLYRVAEYEILPETNLYDICNGSSCTISEDDFYVKNSGTAFGAYCEYTIYATVPVNIDNNTPIDLFDYVLHQSTSNLTYTVGSIVELSFIIKVKGDNIDTELDDISVYTPDSRYNEYDSDKMNDCLDKEEIEFWMSNIAEKTANEIHARLSGLVEY